MARRTVGRSSTRAAAASVKTPRAVKSPPKAERKRSLSPSHSGLKGPPVDLPQEEMNADETSVLATLTRLGGGPFTLKVLASNTFPTAPAVKANSRVRNALRRLVRGQWADQVARGTYKLTKTGGRKARKRSVRSAVAA